MLKGISSNNASFVQNLERIQDRISRTNQQITSGVRVSQPSDDPGAVEPILRVQEELDRINQVTQNLNTAKTFASSADGALQTADNVLNQLTSIAAQGANSTQTADTRAMLGQQVQQLEQQLVSIANTTVQGVYVFGGDNPTTQPYSFDGVNPPVAAVPNPTNTAVIRDVGGNSIVPAQTAQQAFDSPAGSVFQAVDALRVALQTNDQAGVLAAAGSLKTASDQLNLSAQTIGANENWITNALNEASSHVTSLTAQLSSLRDTDVAAAASQLTLDNTAYSAAIASQATLPTKSLFSYLG
ncbi:MAG TPA: flagellar hook-associated protein FlgL [Bryobacteraceae bacterium]|nr:flagellar hook-associated protein FlgL [Bryobacteraceae bacterium]